MPVYEGMVSLTILNLKDTEPLILSLKSKSHESLGCYGLSYCLQVDQSYTVSPKSFFRPHLKAFVICRDPDRTRIFSLGQNNQKESINIAFKKKWK